MILGFRLTGDAVTFTINIQNNGDNATGLTIKDSLPTGLPFQTKHPWNRTYDETQEYGPGNFNNGQTATLTTTALVNSDLRKKQLSTQLNLNL